MCFGATLFEKISNGTAPKAHFLTFSSETKIMKITHSALEVVSAYLRNQINFLDMVSMFETDHNFGFGTESFVNKSIQTI